MPKSQRKQVNQTSNTNLAIEEPNMFDNCETSSMQMLEPAIIHSTQKLFKFDSSAKKETAIFD